MTEDTFSVWSVGYTEIEYGHDVYRDDEVLYETEAQAEAVAARKTADSYEWDRKHNRWKGTYGHKYWTAEHEVIKA